MSEDFDVVDVDRFERTMTQNEDSFASATNPYAETANTNAEEVIRKNVMQTPKTSANIFKNLKEMCSWKMPN